MNEEILKQIEKKEQEIKVLKSQLEKKALSEYDYLNGKFFSLAATCQIKVTKILSLDTHYKCLSIECIRIQGGKHDRGRIEINPNDDYDLSLNEIDEGMITEISKERFISFLEEAFNTTRECLLALL